MQRAIAIACFVLSGIAGLVYEVCWIRSASLVFGSTIFAMSTVLAVFFAGLAIGSEAFGRMAQRSRAPLALYVKLELVLAAAALATLPLFAAIDGLYGAAYRALGDGVWLLLARVALVSLVLLPPTILMGGTLPLFCRQFVVRDDRIGGPVGVLYGLHTLGAAIGAAAAGFALIPAVGVTRTVAIGAALNVAAALLVAMLRVAPVVPVGRRAQRAAPAADVVVSPSPPVSRLLWALVAVTGFLALGAEVLWTRFLGLVTRNTVFTYTLTLAAVLLGIVLGSLAAAAVADRVRARAAWLGALLAAHGLGLLALFGLPPSFWRASGDALEITFLILLPSAALSGAAFPIAARMVASRAADSAAAVGRAAAVNTLGGIVGSLAIGFLALPHLGLQGTALLISGLGVAAAAIAWLLLAPAARGTRLAAGIAVAAWIALPLLSDTRVPVDFLAPRAELVAWEEGLQSNLAVVEREGVRMLEIDRWWQGQSRRTHQIMAAHLPLLLHPAPRRVLVVGAGAGQTPSRVVLHPVERLDVVDIEPAVFELIRPHFESRWMADPRVRLLAADGRSWIAHSGGRYDVISLEVGQIFRPGVASFYTEDFYRDARELLAPGGLLSQFVPLGFLAPDLLRGVIGSFVAAFPNSMLWYNTSELLLVGVRDESLAIDRARIARLVGAGPIHEDLQYAHWGGPEQWLHHPDVLLGGYLAGPRGLAALARGAVRLRDDRPLLEYAAAFVHEHQGNELANLDLLRPSLDPVEALVRPPLHAAAVAAIRSTRDLNLGQIAANATLKRLEHLPLASDAALAVLEQALAFNPHAPKAVRLMGEALAARGALHEAERHLKRAVALRPDDPVARRSLDAVMARRARADVAPGRPSS